MHALSQMPHSRTLTPLEIAVMSLLLACHFCGGNGLLQQLILFAQHIQGRLSCLGTHRHGAASRRASCRGGRWRGGVNAVALRAVWRRQSVTLRAK